MRKLDDAPRIIQLTRYAAGGRVAFQRLQDDARKRQVILILDKAESTKPVLPEPLAQAPTSSARERLRRSRLDLPGNKPKFKLNAGLHGADDGIILNLVQGFARVVC